MQAPKRESVMSASIPFVYLKNSRVTELVDHLKYSRGEDNKVVPSSVYYMCTGDKFVPISTDTSVLHTKNNPTISENFIQKSGMLSKTLAPPKSFIPQMFNNKIYSPNSEKVYMNVSNINMSRSNNSEKQAQNNNFGKQKAMKNQEVTENAKSVQSLHTRRVFFTGTIERILRWSRNLQDIFCLYETIAPVISLQEGRITHQKIMLLRDKKGPILQVQFFSSTHIDINDFHIGQYLRCVGRMTGMNILSAESIREAKEEEILNLSRLSYVCDYSVNQNMIRE